ncbi:MAG: hypothetical protein ABII71_02380 [Candidatus Micrarchaeota archaeon]
MALASTITAEPPRPGKMSNLIKKATALVDALPERRREKRARQMQMPLIRPMLKEIRLCRILEEKTGIPVASYQSHLIALYHAGSSELGLEGAARAVLSAGEKPFDEEAIQHLGGEAFRRIGEGSGAIFNATSLLGYNPYAPANGAAFPVNISRNPIAHIPITTDPDGWTIRSLGHQKLETDFTYAYVRVDMPSGRIRGFILKDGSSFNKPFLAPLIGLKVIHSVLFPGPENNILLDGSDC